MKRCWTACIAAMLAAATIAQAAAQPREKNPVEGDPDAVKRGSLLFRARCAGCHGLDARGVSGPDLTVLLGTGMTDDRFFRTVRNGMGTEMPRFSTEQTTDTQVWEILSHLRVLTQGAASDAPRGNAANGSRIFETRCASCHKVNGRGGSLGPDLSRIGAMRSATALAAKIRNPNRSLVPGFYPVTVVLADGRRVRGVKKNEDAFSIQLMDLGERLQGFRKAELREVIREARSPMPAFGTSALSDADLADLVTFLTTLRGAVPVAAD